MTIIEKLEKKLNDFFSQENVEGRLLYTQVKHWGCEILEIHCYEKGTESGYEISIPNFSKHTLQQLFRIWKKQRDEYMKFFKGCRNYKA